MNSATNTLLVFSFETGDSSVKAYEVFTILNNNSISLEEIEDCMMSFCNSTQEDLTYEEMVECVLESFPNISWSFMRMPLNNITDIRIIYV